MTDSNGRTWLPVPWIAKESGGHEHQQRRVTHAIRRSRTSIRKVRLFWTLRNKRVPAPLSGCAFDPADAPTARHLQSRPANRRLATSRRSSPHSSSSRKCVPGKARWPGVKSLPAAVANWRCSAQSFGRGVTASLLKSRLERAKRTSFARSVASTALAWSR